MRSEVIRAAQVGVMTWWLNAALAHTEPLDEASPHLLGDVIGMSPDDHRQSWILATGGLRGAGIDHLRLAIVEPGDPLGVAGPAPVTAAAVSAGMALVSDVGGVTFIPDAEIGLWTRVASRRTLTPAGLGTVANARTVMREAMHTLSATFPTVDPDEQVMAELTSYRQFGLPITPYGISERTREIATDSLRVWWLTAITRDFCERSGLPVPTQLRELRPAARRAAAVAFSEVPQA